MPVQQRPLSPFMIGPYYRPQLTSVLSFMHRITGCVLAAAGVYIATALLCLAQGPEVWAVFLDWAGGMPGKILAVGFIFALWFHFCNGIRHLGWDVGWGFELNRTYLTGWITVVASIGLTALTVWCLWTRLSGGAA